MMLFAGLVTVIITFIRGCSIIYKLVSLLIVFLIFYIIGSVIVYALDHFDKVNEKAVEMLGLEKEQVLCIGDQVFTDILGANMAGIRSILVKFIGYYTEKHIGKRRRLEKVILRLYRLDRGRYNRLGQIEKQEAGNHGRKEA